jgi:hypothetical protein
MRKIVPEISFAGKYWASLAAILILAALVFVSFGGAVRLNAQSPVASVPDVTGHWVGVSWGDCSFENVWDPNGQPSCEVLPGGPPMKVTIQQGQAFAGTFPPMSGSKITGVIAEDGTFTMQAWIGNNRIFFSGKLSFKRNALEMKGVANGFEDWLAGTPSMGSIWFTFRKVN